jgi:hypothetical protein
MFESNSTIRKIQKEDSVTYNTFWLVLTSTLILGCSPLPGAVSVLKYHNDNGGTGVNSAETVLTPAKVANNFGKLYSLPVDGQIYAQPLYLSGVTIPGVGVKNILYVATEHNSVYAFDADSSSATPVWQVNLGLPMQCSSIPGCNRDLLPEIGITSTPVIDVNRQAIYVVAETFNSGNAAFTLHSLDLVSGTEKRGSPVVIAGQVAGTSSEGNGTVVPFNAFMHWQRAALLGLNGNVYVAFGGHQDTPPYHGWIFGYDGLSLRRTDVKCMSPDAGYSGIWQGGEGLTADNAGFIYLATGNGLLTASTQGRDYGDSVLKLNSLAHLDVTGYFSPSDQVAMNNRDADLGSGGVLVIPGSVAQSAPRLLAGGKDGRVFLLDSGNLSGFNPTDSVLQEFQASTRIFSGKIFFNNALYTWGSSDFLKRYAFNGTSLSASSASTFQIASGYSNEPAMSISANGVTNGILWASWAISGSSSGTAVPGTLHAFDASDVSVELWNSERSAGDTAGSWAKWCPPTIANGKVFLATFDKSVTVFGLH